MDHADLAKCFPAGLQRLAVELMVIYQGKPLWALEQQLQSVGPALQMSLNLNSKDLPTVLVQKSVLVVHPMEKVWVGHLVLEVVFLV